MNDDELFELTYNEITGEFEDTIPKDDSGLTYNWETDEFEDSRIYKDGEVPDYLLTSCISPPQEMLDLLRGVTEKMISSYKTKKAKAIRIIQEYEDNGVYLTREQKIQLFQNIINE